MAAGAGESKITSWRNRSLLGGMGCVVLFFGSVPF